MRLWWVPVVLVLGLWVAFAWWLVERGQWDRIFVLVGVALPITIYAYVGPLHAHEERQRKRDTTGSVGMG